jgi:hypothetical protein
MEDTRLTILPDENFTDLVSALEGRLSEIGRSVTAANFASLLDETMRQVILIAVAHAGATEGTVWIADKPADALVVAYNTGPNAEKLAGNFKQSYSSGLIGMVYASEHSFLENDVFKDPQQDKSLDNLLNVRTTALIATPFYFLRACRGVISCVQLTAPGAADSTRPFTDRDSTLMHHAAILLGRLIDLAVLHASVGLD